MISNERQRMTLLLALLAGTSVAACGDPYPAETTGQKMESNAPNVATPSDRAVTPATTGVDDVAITTKVKSAVLAEPGLKVLQINVDTRDGVVTLSGTVDNAALKGRATQLAQQVSGVRAVVDNLVVKSTG